MASKGNRKPTQDEQDLHRLVASIMTKNVNITREEYNEVLKRVGVKEEDLDKCTDEERTARIRQNFYGTMLNMFLSTFSQLRFLQEEVEVFRAQLNAICEKLGIDTSELKTSTDRVNEAAEQLLKKKANFNR